MRSITAIVAAGAAALMTVAAHAQPSTQVPAPTPSQGKLTTTTTMAAPPVGMGLSAVQGQHPLFTLGNLQGFVAAPVATPGDSNGAYGNFEGQPASGRDALLTQPPGSGPAQ